MIVLTTHVDPPDQMIADALRDHLRASLGARAISLCTDASRVNDPVGHILLEVNRPATGPIWAHIVVGDSITNKRVERTMDLSAIPPDARPFAVSMSGDELLRATWAELVLKDAPVPARPPPKAVVESVASSVRPIDEMVQLASPEPAIDRPQLPPPEDVDEHTFQLGFIGRATAFENLQSFGVDARIAYWSEERVGAFASARFSFGPQKDGPNGAVSQETQGGSLGFAYAFWPLRGAASLAAEAELGVHRVEFDPGRNSTVLEEGATDWTLDTGFGPTGYVTVDSVQFSLGLAMRVALRPAEAIDENVVVLSNRRVGGEASLGMHLAL